MSEIITTETLWDQRVPWDPATTPHFSAPELECHCGCGRADMDQGFMQTLEAIRVELNRPLVVTSGFRCPDHNAKIHGGPAHPQGRAADFAISGEPAWDLLDVVWQVNHDPTVLPGITGVGIRQKGEWKRRFIHLDNLPQCQSPKGLVPRPRVLTY